MPGYRRRMSPTGRVAVIGDVGGHLEPLRRELVRLGADPASLRLPADLTVVQVGDLVHRGPDSGGVVALVDHLLDMAPRQWVQLVGNHEAQYVREPAFDWPERLDPSAVARLRHWWATGRMRVAAAVTAGDEPWLITHAGLTVGFWREALGAPTSAGHAAAAINSFIGTHDDVLFHAGEMLGGGDPDPTAGPVWAAAGSELLPGWFAAPDELPFSQVYGHSTVVDWRRRRLLCADDVAALVELDVERAHVGAAVGSHRIVGVDPKHGKKAHSPWEALVLQDATVTSWP